MQEPKVFLAMPSRGSVAVGTMTALHQCGRQTPVHCIRTYTSSLLTLCFNNLWCAALNERKHGITHFVMIHDDVVPLEEGWLDTLLQEQRECKADVLSAVIPIKDERGLSSTAFLNRLTNRMRRLTMTEAHQLPATFDAAGAGYPDCSLLPNTGLWVCDFTKPWAEKICFTIRDKNFQTESGEWVTQCFSEDWDFGVQAARLGLSVWATTRVKVSHKGGFDYPNFLPWGNLKTDDAQGIWSPPRDEGTMPEPLYERETCLI